jgi:aryl-alcohol dehydrogenase-like predicted oxidoreductase
MACHTCGRAVGRGRRWVAEHRDQVEAYEDLCQRYGHPSAELALAWLLTRPNVKTSP